MAKLRARGALDAARGALQGTPGRLRIASLVTALASLAFAALAATAFANRAAALSDARAGAAQLVRVQTLQIDLFQAHADATNAFLTGGLEPAAQRRDYEQSVSAASALVAEAARANPADAERLGEVNAALTVYTGLVEQARANNRQGFPVGSAYLRQATDVLTTQIKPALAQVRSADEALVTSAYDRSRSAVVGLWLPGVALLVVLAVTQGWLAGRTHRVLNVPLSGATAAILVGLLAGLGVMALAQSRAQQVREHSYAATRALAQARIAAYEGKANESLTLINRGNGGDYETAWKSDAAAVRRGLDAASASGASISTQPLQGWTVVHAEIRSLDDGGDWDAAVALATGTGSGSANAAFSALATSTGKTLTEQAQRVGDDLASSHVPLIVAAVLLALLGLVAAAASWVGISLRLEEYR